MTSFFNVSSLAGNVFSTPVGQRIEQATDASLASENWALNMEICDMINESSDAARDAMKAIRKRLSQNAGKNYTVIMYTLTVLETCVKNCGKAFHVLVANKEFIQDLVKLIGPKNDPPAVVQEKVLNLIQIWADAFRSQPDLNGVVQVYQELKSKGIEFPVADLDAMAPIYTPQRSVPESASPPVALSTSPTNHPDVTQANPTPVVTIPSGPVTLTPEQITKLQSELEIVSMNMTIFGEMLTALKPGQEDPSDYKLLADLSQTCSEMQSRIVDLIGRVTHDEITAELLRLNDELNNLFLRYQRYEKNRDPKNTSTPSAILGAALRGPTDGRGKDSLIDLEESPDPNDKLSNKFSGLSVGGMASSQLSQINSVTAQSGGKDVDEFDMLAQSRNDAKSGTPSKGAKKPEVVSVAKQSDPKSDTKSDKKTDQKSDTKSDKKTDQKSDQKSNEKSIEKNANESELDEMAAWLKDADTDKGPEDSLTSTEFERFLAERAAAADNLPNISGGGDANSNGTPNKKSTSKKAEDSLLL